MTLIKLNPTVTSNPLKLYTDDIANHFSSLTSNKSSNHITYINNQKATSHHSRVHIIQIAVGLNQNYYWWGLDIFYFNITEGLRLWIDIIPVFPLACISHSVWFVAQRPNRKLNIADHHLSTMLCEVSLNMSNICQCTTWTALPTGCSLSKLRIKTRAVYEHQSCFFF